MKTNAKVTLTAVKPKERYGILKIMNNKVTYFNNENKKTDTYVNGGYFVIDKSCIKKINIATILIGNKIHLKIFC